MGRAYLFECSKCGYRARVAGGSADGEQFSVQTVLCADCKELFDAVIEYKTVLGKSANETDVEKSSLQNKLPKISFLLNRLPPRGSREWLKFKPACPVSPSHRVRLWKMPGKCPKCGAFMEHEGIPFRIWD